MATHKNITADTLSRLDIVDTNNLIKTKMLSLAEHFSLEKEDILHPLIYKTIMQYKQNKKLLIETAKLNKDYSMKHFHGVDKKHSLICEKAQNSDIYITRKTISSMVS